MSEPPGIEPLDDGEVLGHEVCVDAEGHDAANGLDTILEGEIAGLEPLGDDDDDFAALADLDVEPFGIEPLVDEGEAEPFGIEPLHDEPADLEPLRDDWPSPAAGSGGRPATHDDSWAVGALVPHKNDAPARSADTGQRTPATGSSYCASTSCDGTLCVWALGGTGPPPCVKSLSHNDICVDFHIDWTSMSAVTVGGDYSLTVTDMNQAEGGEQGVAKGVVGRLYTDGPRAITTNFICCDATYGTAVVGAGMDIKVADLEAHKWSATLRGHQDHVNDIRGLWEERLVVTAGWDRLLKMWDLRSGRCVKTMPGHNRPISKMDINWNMMLAFTTALQDSCILWDLRQGRPITDAFAGARDCCVQWDIMRVVTCGSAKHVEVWDLEPNSMVAQWEIEDCKNPQSVDVNWETNELLIATWDYKTLLYDVSTGECMKRMCNQERTLTKTRLSPAMHGAGPEAAFEGFFADMAEME